MMSRLPVVFSFLFLPFILSAGNWNIVSSTPQYKAWVDEGIQHMYNGEYFKADDAFNQLKAALPNHPVYRVLKAFNLNWQWWPLKTENNLKTLMVDYLNEASDACRKRLASPSTADEETMFLYYASEGLLSRLAMEDGHYAESVGHAKNAYAYVKKGFLLMDKFPDFYFSTGVYNFYREKFPELHPALKPLVYFMDKGDVSLGIIQVKKSYYVSLFSKAESINYLASIFLKYLNDPKSFLPYSTDVTHKFPNNLFFLMKHGETLIALNDFEKAKPIIKKLYASNNAYYMMVSLYQLAMVQLSEGQTAEAIKSAELALARLRLLKEPNDNSAGFIYRVLAHGHDQLKNAAKARLYYQLMADKSEYPWYQEEAKAWLKVH